MDFFECVKLKLGSNVDVVDNKNGSRFIRFSTEISGEQRYFLMAFHKLSGMTLLQVAVRYNEGVSNFGGDFSKEKFLNIINQANLNINGVKLMLDDNEKLVGSYEFPIIFEPLFLEANDYRVQLILNIIFDRFDNAYQQVLRKYFIIEKGIPLDDLHI